MLIERMWPRCRHVAPSIERASIRARPPTCQNIRAKKNAHAACSRMRDLRARAGECFAAVALLPLVGADLARFDQVFPSRELGGLEFGELFRRIADDFETQFKQLGLNG